MKMKKNGSSIPPAFSGFRIAQVSDLYNAEFEKNNATLPRMLSENKPDIIVITEDLVDSAHTGSRHSSCLCKRGCPVLKPI